MASLRCTFFVLFACIVFVAAGYAQANSGATAAPPAFDVASIRANNSGTGVDRISNSGGTLVIENVSLKRLIGMAFEIPEAQDYLFSGPAWLDSENFDIQARFPPDTPDPVFHQMLQRLLGERFRMTVHCEPREFSVLALLPGKGNRGGVALHPAAAPDAPYRFRAIGGHASASSVSMAMLAGRLSRPDFGLGRPVLDLTGLSGTYDLTLDWKPDNLPEGAASSGRGSDASIFAAIEEQPGLKLEPRRLSLDVLVIDRIEKMPTAN